MLAKFFIDRPIFASVLSIVIALAGAISAFQLAISQYPPVTPPTIQVDCAYPGSSSKIVAETIAAPIEQRVNGVERMLYMTSQSTSDGSYTLTVAFEPGTNLDLAQVMVQNRVNLALPELPDVVKATGVTTRKRSPEILLTISINSPATADDPQGRYDQLFLSNYAVTRIKDELSRIQGISDVTVFGQRDYSMRVHVDPVKLSARGLTSLDVVNAVRQQNLQVSLGRLGDDDQTATSIPMTVVGRLTTEAEFANVVVKATPNAVVRVRDIGRVELNAKAQDVENRFDNKPTIGLAIFLLSDANALQCADEIKAAVAVLAKELPAGIACEIGYDTTPFMRESIREVFKALRDSVILVAIVVLVFLQTWRAAIIPLAAVPTAIVGTFGAMWLVGFGLNNLTLFGLVLSVGIVVDDAIVVVEAVQHQLEKGLSPRAATLAAMEDVGGPIVAVGAVLVAVFVPCAFFPGIVGSFFRQFALTIAISTLISTFNSLTLSPALAAILLQRKGANPDLVTRGVNRVLGRFFRAFNAVFRGGGLAYVATVRGLIRLPLLAVVAYAGVLVATYFGYLKMPTGFIPQQDKGYLIASVQLPDAASAERTREEVRKITEIALGTPGVGHVNSVAGNSFVLSAYGSNFGSMFIILDPFEKRLRPESYPDITLPDGSTRKVTAAELYSDNVATELRKRIGANVHDAQVNLFGAPAVPGLGRAGGFRLMVEDRGVEDMDFLSEMADNLVQKGNATPGLVGLFTVFRTNSPQLRVQVNAAACSAEGIDVRDVYAVMQSTLGVRYVNDFNRFGRTWQVNVQADRQFRDDANTVRKLKIKNKAGNLVPLGAVATVTEPTGPLVLTRYNMYPAAAINGNVKAGTSSGAALASMRQLAERELPSNMGAEWTELAFIEERSRDTGLAVFGIAVAVVFLVLAFLYESWALPLAVILVVPMCVSSSLLGVYFARQDVNVFTQVGFVVLIGLACKNAILIVEYAKRQRDAGADRRTAVLEACHLRLRPILMTSAAFVLGVLPLVLATGAGAEMRTALGVAVFAGMIGVTFFGIFLTPVFYVLVDRLSNRVALDVSWLRQAWHAVRYVVKFEFLRPVIRRVVRVNLPTGT